jgi:hypothetical protein
MPALQDITGQEFNYYTAVSYLGNKKWLFRCRCGAERELFSRSVIIGSAKSCGCKPRSRRAADLTGENIGYWTLITRHLSAYPSGRKNTSYTCRCACGVERVIGYFSLKKGDSISCGTCDLNRSILPKGQEPQRLPKLADIASYNYMRGRRYKEGYILCICHGHPRSKHPSGGRAYIPEHRLVMEQMIGRYLSSEETVHHINGVKTDNRPENLELFSSRHPAGQRVIDQVQWAVELLSKYRPELLASTHRSETTSEYIVIEPRECRSCASRNRRRNSINQC